MRTLLRQIVQQVKFQGKSRAPGVHGLRSTFKDWCRDESGHDDETSEQALAHRTGDQAKAAYIHGVMLKKRRALMNECAVYLSTGVVDNVIPLRA